MESKKFKETVLRVLLPHIILTEAANRSIHGYALINLMRRKHGVYFGPSTVYPTLIALERDGLIQSRWVQPNLENRKPRKIYSITDKGKRLLGQTTTVLVETLTEVKM